MNSSAADGIATIALVALATAAIFVPISRATKPSSRAQCIGTLRFLGKRSLLYVSDYDDRFPPASRWTDLLPRQGHLWEPGLLTCIDSPGIDFSYAMHDAISGASPSKLPNPARQLMLFDSVSLLPNAHGDERLLPSPPRHGNVNNGVYADGHAAAHRVPTATDSEGE